MSAGVPSRDECLAEFAEVVAAAAIRIENERYAEAVAAQGSDALRKKAS